MRVASENDRAFQMARDELIREFNLVSIVRDLRLSRIVMKQILGMDDYMQAKMKAKKKRLRVR